MFILNEIFCGTLFFLFSGECVGHLDVFFVVSIINSTGSVIIAEKICVLVFFVRKKFSSQHWQFSFFGLNYLTFIEFLQT